MAEVLVSLSSPLAHDESHSLITEVLTIHSVSKSSSRRRRKQALRNLSLHKATQHLRKLPPLPPLHPSALAPPAIHLRRKKDNLDAIIGDLDSLTTQARVHFESFNTRVIHDADQESTDFGKAITHVRSYYRNSPVDIAAVGGLGGRVDQGLSQLHHLFLFQTGEGYEQGRIHLVSEESVTVLLKAGRHVIQVRSEEGEEDVFGRYVGILPVKEPSVITTRGLEWDVEGWETGFGGRMSTSNHLLPESKVVEVETSKDVLFTISLQ